MPAKMVARRTETKVNRADTVASLARALKVRGKEHKNWMTAMMAAKPTVQTPGFVAVWLEMVFRYSAPTRQWKPWMKVLLSRNMKPVKYHAQRLFQKSIWPMSQTSLTSG